MGVGLSGARGDDIGGRAGGNPSGVAAHPLNAQWIAGGKLELVSAQRILPGCRSILRSFVLPNMIKRVRKPVLPSIVHQFRAFVFL